MEESVPVLIGAACALIASCLPSSRWRTAIMVTLGAAGGAGWSIWLGETESSFAWAVFDAAQSVIAFALLCWAGRRVGLSAHLRGRG